METARENLIQALDKARKRRQMSDRKFSTEVLGISHSYWSLLRAGKRCLTPNLAVLFMQKLPELTPEVTKFIVHQGNDGEKKTEVVKTGGESTSAPVKTRKVAPTPQKTPQNAQGG